MECSLGTISLIISSTTTANAPEGPTVIGAVTAWVRGTVVYELGGVAVHVPTGKARERTIWMICG